jgi:hypothetical protein
LITDERFLIDTTVPTFGDWDWFLRMAKAGKQFYYLPEILTGFRVHSASRTMRMDRRMIREERRMLTRRHNIALSYMNLWIDIIIPFYERMLNAQLLMRNRQWREMLRRLVSAATFIFRQTRHSSVL